MGENMPYNKFKENDKWMVYKVDADGKKTGNSLGSHAKEDEADSQIAALYASEKKETTIHTKMYEDEKVEYNPAISFAELDAMEEAEHISHSMRKASEQFSQMANNIFYRDDIEDKAAALEALASEFTDRVKNPPMTKERWQPLTDKVVAAVKSVKEAIAPKTKEKDLSFQVWHNKETNQYRWFAIYSNKYRDNDNPPEIISDASHKNFVKGVENGDYPYPELWLWHVKDSRVGQADWLAYTDEGFALASGYFDPGKEHVAKGLMSYEGKLLTSHGMPKPYIERDPQDPSILVKHITKEISPLPASIAANKLTNFELLRKEVEMIPDDKKEFLKQVGMTEDEISQIEGKVKETADKAQEEGIEFKEETPQEQEGFKPEDLIKAMETMINPLVEKVQALETEVKALKQEDEAKVKEVVKNTPKSSLEALAQKSVQSLFSEVNKVDGRESLARSGPTENKGKEKQSGLFFQEWMMPAQEEVNA